MGRGVGAAVGRAGHRFVLVDRDEETLRRAAIALRDELRSAALLLGDGGESVDRILERSVLTTDLGAVANAGIVIENVTERWDVKRSVYDRLDRLCSENTPFAVNTSAIPITKLAALTQRPARVVGMHFMNPAVLTPTVELIRGHHTSDATIRLAQEFLTGIGKASVVVNDSPGFVTNRTLMLTINEAIFTLHERVATAAQIDRLFVECFGHKMGPLETADLIGLDTVLLSIEVLYDSFKDSKYRPCPLLQTMVDAGLYGRKTGQGFFSYRVSAEA